MKLGISATLLTLLATLHASLSDECPERFCLWNADADIPVYKFAVWDDPIKFCQQDYEFSVQVVDGCSLPPSEPFKEARITTTLEGGFTTSKRQKEYPLMAFGDRVSAQNVFGRDMVLGKYHLDVTIEFGNDYEGNDIDFEIVDGAVDPSCIDVETTPETPEPTYYPTLKACIDQVPWL